MKNLKNPNPFKMEYLVYCNISATKWAAHLLYGEEHVSIEGENIDSDKNRNELQSTLEILQFLRNWVDDKSVFTIYTNSQYTINCLERWIPLWIQKGFRINHTANLRPNTDLLVKLHSFHTCMNVTLSQHYNDYEKYCSFFT